MTQKPNEPPTSASDTPVYDARYADWKSWHKGFVVSTAEMRYFEGEFSSISLRGKRVLEIGFGSGSFMAWAKQQGAITTGCELIGEMVEQGQQQGYDTRLGDPRTVIDQTSERFDVIVAFDVLEHIPAQELLAFIRGMRELLVDQGVILARTPNGESPFGRFYQHGDITHVSTLSMGKYHQIAPQTGLRVVRCSNAFRVADPASGYWGYRDRIRLLTRSAIEWLICFAYGFSRRPLDPNLVAVLQRT